MNRQKDEPTLQEIYDLAQENNNMLRAMRREAFWGAIIKFVLWVVVILVIPYFLFAFWLQPYLANIISAYQGFEENTEQLNASLKGIPDIGSFFEQFGGGSEE
jgi:hypothetical protein